SIASVCNSMPRMPIFVGRRCKSALRTSQFARISRPPRRQMRQYQRRRSTMLVGVPKEIKNHEYRVGLTPESVAELTHSGQKVLVETGAGNGIGASDDDYRAAGASIAGTAAEVFRAAEMIVKVKEPQAAERAMLRPDQVLF